MAPGTVVRGGTLVVCNVSLVGQWQSELKKVINSDARLKVHQYHGAKRLKNAAKLSEFDVVITTYSILGTEFGAAKKQAEKAASKLAWRCESFDCTDHYGAKPGPEHEHYTFFCPRCNTAKPIASLASGLRKTTHKPPCEQVMWHRIVLDESHYIKNPSAQWSKACLELRGANKWCVTGTPMGTSMTDMASQLDFVGWGADGEVGRVREITQALGGQVGSRHQRWRYGVNHGFDEKTLYRLHRRTMRHTMTQKRHGRSLLELPARRDRVLKVSFLPAEATAYKAIAKDVRVIWEKLLAANAVQSNMIQALACLAKLRAACSPGESMRIEE